MSDAERFPADLLENFRVLEQLDFPSRRGHTYFLVQGRNAGVLTGPGFLKVARFDPIALDLERTIQSQTTSDQLNTCCFATHDDDRMFIVARYHAYGTLRSVIDEDSPDLDAVRGVVRQLNDALKQLHDDCGVAHCDLKPSNILTVSRGSGRLEVALGDFGNATSTAGQMPRARGYTLRYAAPEIIVANVPLTGAADYWSLGAVLYEWCSGDHMFASISDSQIYQRLPAYRPVLSRIGDTALRALISGLLQVDRELRFGPQDIDRWLDGDPAIVSLGLSLSGEPASNQPLVLSGRHIFSARGLAEALLQIDDPSLVTSEELMSWIEHQLARPDVAIEMRRMGQSISNQRQRLLEACFFLWPQMLAVWRGMELTTECLTQNCRSALGGSEDAVAWLWSLWNDSDVMEFFGQRAAHNDDFRRLVSVVDTVRHSLVQTDQAWDSLVERGAPPDSRLTGEQELPHVMLAALDSAYADDLRERARSLFAPESLLLRADWFYALGTGSSLPVTHLHVLLQLETLSRLDALRLDDVRQLRDMDLSTARQSVLMFQTQRSLMNGLRVRPGASIAHFHNGGVYDPNGRFSLRRVLWENVGIPLAESVAWIVSRLRGLLSRPDPDDTGPQEDSPRDGEPQVADQDTDPDSEGLAEPEYDAYVLPLVPQNPGQGFGERGSIYMLRVSWTARSGRRVTLSLRSGRFGFGRRRLKLYGLPENGSVVLCIDKRCRVLLREQAGFITSHRFRRLSLLLPTRHNALLAVRRARLLKAQALRSAVQQASVSASITASSSIKALTPKLEKAKLPSVRAAEIKAAAGIRYAEPQFVAPATTDREYKRILTNVRAARNKSKERQT